jgi:hypothetical protein
VDLPRSGEVLVEKRRLSEDPTRSRYLRIGIASASPVQTGPKYLTSDAGDWYFLAGGFVPGTIPPLFDTGR